MLRAYGICMSPLMIIYKPFQDVDKCIAVMEDLDHLPVNHVMLKKNPDIMNTIKKVGTFLKQRL
jgi:hypothetical protein